MSRTNATSLIADRLRCRSRRFLWLLLAALSLVGVPAIAQTVPSVGDYFAFDVKNNSNAVVLRGRLVVGSVQTVGGTTSGTFSSVIESSTFYTPGGIGTTAYGVSNTAAAPNTSTNFGTFTSTTGGYYINAVNFGFTVDGPQYYVLSGTAGSVNSGNFSLYSTTYTAGGGYATKNTASGFKLLSTGTGTEVGTFSTAEVPEIDGGTLPRSPTHNCASRFGWRRV